MTYHNADMTALDRFEMVVRIIAENEVACSLMEKLLSAAERYFCKVFEMETRLKIARLRVDGNELRELTENLDKNRMYAHEALISDLHIKPSDQPPHKKYSDFAHLPHHQVQ